MRNKFMKRLSCFLALLLIFYPFAGVNIIANAASYSNVTSDITLTDGDTISGTVSECTVTIPSGTTVTVTGQVTISGTVNFVGGGMLKRSSSFNNASMIIVNSGAKLNVGTETKAGIAIDGNGTYIDVNGGAINDNGGTVNLFEGANVTNNYIKGSLGGGIYINSGTLNMHDGTEVTDNWASSDSFGGGGIAINTGATFNMDGGTISGNQSLSTAKGSGGGGVIVKGTFNMGGGVFTGNRANRSGGAVHIYGGSLNSGFAVMTMTGGLITGNFSSSYAGGIEILYEAGLNLQGGKIVGNTSGTGDGGGIELDAKGYSGYLKVSGAAQVTGNSKGTKQNNVYLDKRITVTGNITGSMGVTCESNGNFTNVNTAGGIFGTATGSNYAGMQNFFVDGKSIVGKLDGTNVEWESTTDSLTGITLSTSSPVTGTAITTTLTPDRGTATYQWYRNDRSTVSGGTPIVGATSSSYTPTSADVGKYLYVVTDGVNGYTGRASGVTSTAVQYGSKVSTPTFSIAGGTYSSSQSVELSCSTEGAGIYYTLNGDTPTTGSTKYSGPITVSSATVLKAIAVKSDCADSNISTATYNIIKITVTPCAETYDGFAHDVVSLSGTQEGDTITYSTNGTDFSSTCPQITNVGNYNVYVKVQRNGVVWTSNLNAAVISCARISGGVSIPDTIATGNTVSANVSAVLPYDATFSYQWKLNGTVIDEVTGSSYTVQPGDYGKTLSVKLTGTGNYVSSITSNEVMVSDGKAPANLTIKVQNNSYTSFLHTIVFGLFFNNTVDVMLSAADAQSGVDYYEYQLVDTSCGQSYNQDGPWTRSDNGTFSVSPQFKGAVYAYAVDKAGNVTAVSEVVQTNGFVVDNQAPTAPAIDATVNGDSYNSSWTSGDVQLVASGSSGLSGIDYYQYSTDNGAHWTNMPDESGATDSTSGNDIANTLTITSDMNGDVHVRAVSNSGVDGNECIILVKRDAVTPAIHVDVTGITGQWTQGPIAFMLSNTAGNISPITYWERIGAADWAPVSGNAATVTGNVSTAYQFKTVSGAGLVSTESVVYTVKLDSAPIDSVNDQIDQLPNPGTATEQQIIDSEQQIRDAKTLYDSLDAKEKNAVGTARQDKLNQLIYRLSALLVIIPKDQGTGITAGNLGTSVLVPELNDPDVRKVIVQLVVDQVSNNAASSANLAVAEATLDKGNKSLVAAYDVSLIKTVFDAVGKQTSYGKISNSSVVGPVTIRIPVPSEYSGKTDLQIVYIDDNGNVTPLATSVVTVDGVQYLQFTATHFSVYAITAPNTVFNPKTGDSHSGNSFGYVWPLGISGLAISMNLILRRRKRKGTVRQG